MTVYLIHFETKIGRSQHYLGSTHDDRLKARMREHALGNGAALTRRAVRLGVRMYLARTFPGYDHNQERMMKRHGRFKLMCPLCCPMLSVLADQVSIIDATRPDQPAPQPVLAWNP